ncbi:dehydrogenase-like protein [Lacticaseibacillus paracasei subsp. paracasei Lpp14]|uniref:Dehydrogenase-like protein n=1 Tax=Lacticaseibacillus paracasei subsp. paracasei Lpp14 TaxID=1256204 RepID=A0A829GPR1_LACPA|nr:dehydrogenase-like protein [Lacticaseibacillus paracasei subsp. paracasei Lpp14]
MLTIGVMGLGTIAQKAYLPVYTQMQNQVHWVLSTRNDDKLQQLATQDGLVIAGTTLEDLDAQPLDAVMIHTPTETHYQYVKHFLEKGVNVFVDKPLATDMGQINELYDLADTQHVLLTVGFNRRFAPMIQDLAEVDDKTGVRVDKNRIDAPDDPEHALWDLFIHPVDTALMLAGYPEKPNTRYSLHTGDDGKLQQASVIFTAPGIRGEAGIDLQAGTNLEEAQVAAPSGVQRVQNLDQLVVYGRGGATQTFAPDWQPMLTTRGFQPMVQAFVQAVADPEGKNPVSPATSQLAHAVVADLVNQIKA